MTKRKITIEIEVDRMNLYDTDYVPEFTTKLQLEITEVIQKETRKWNRWHDNKMSLSLISNKNEKI